MSERKINLEEIISKTYGCEDIYEFQRSFDISVSMIKEICINVCRQVLELAAENAKTSHDYYDKWDENEAYNKHKDFGFERCDGDGIPYGVDVITINKQSIIDTINQVE